MAWEAAVNRKNNGAKRLFVQGILLTVREFCCCCSGGGGGGGGCCLFVCFCCFFCLFFEKIKHTFSGLAVPTKASVARSLPAGPRGAHTAAFLESCECSRPSRMREPTYGPVAFLCSHRLDCRLII